MVRNRKWLFLGLALVALSVFLFARFWAVSGTEAPLTGSGALSNLDWGAFFVSPVLFIGGVSMIVVAIILDRAHHAPHTRAAPVDILAQMRVLESTH